MLGWHSPLSGVEGVIGMSTRSIHEGIFMPPLQVTGLFGAYGRTNLTYPPRDRANDAQVSDHPCGESPSPCIQITTAVGVASFMAKTTGCWNDAMS